MVTSTTPQNKIYLDFYHSLVVLRIAYCCNYTMDNDQCLITHRKINFHSIKTHKNTSLDQKYFKTTRLFFQTVFSKLCRAHLSDFSFSVFYRLLLAVPARHLLAYDNVSSSLIVFLALQFSVFSPKRISKFYLKDVVSVQEGGGMRACQNF